MCISNEEETGVKVPHNQINYNTVAGTLGLASFLGLNANGLFNRNYGCNGYNVYGENGYGHSNSFEHGFEHGFAHGYEEGAEHRNGCGNNYFNNNGFNGVNGFAAFNGIQCHPDVKDFVTQKEMDYEKQIIDLKSANAIQTSNQYTDGHIIEAYKDTVARFNKADEKLQAEIKENMVSRIEQDKQIAVLQTQLMCLEERLKAANASTNQKMDYEVRGVYREIDNTKTELRGAIALESERRQCGDSNIYNYVNGTFVPGKLVMPIDSVCPQPMQRYNSWEAPTNSNMTVTTETSK